MGAAEPASLDTAGETIRTNHYQALEEGRDIVSQTSRAGFCDGKVYNS